MNRTSIYLMIASLATLITPICASDNSLSSNPYRRYFDHIASSPELRKQCGSFLSSVLRLDTAGKLNTILDTLPDNTYAPGVAHYNHIQQHRSSLNPHYSLPYQLRLLNYQKGVLTEQAHQLLAHQKDIEGALEIGTPGTYLSSILKTASHTERIYVMNDKQQLTDRVQAFSYNPFNSFLPYDTFIQLNNYEPISPNDIPDNSLDLCVCFIGLHHIPQEKIEGFVASIARVLRPGGIFLLREHDAHNEDVKALVYAAHSLFNILVPNESIETELAEYRNFQPLNYWIDLLEQHGLKVGQQCLLQNGDPTLNTMLTFTKLPKNQHEQEIVCLKRLQKETAVRDLLQTYLSAPEWYNVDISQKYASFINHTPFYEFPYFSSVSTYWKIFFHSIAAAARKQGTFNALTSSYNLMNLFIGTTMSIEYAAKGIISLPIQWMYSGQEASTIQVLLKDPMRELQKIDERIYIASQDEDTQLTLANFPRYKEFLPIIQKIEYTNIELYEIAGHKQIACKVRYPKALHNACQDISGCILEYTWSVPTESDHLYATLTVQVDSLKKVIKALEDNGIELLYIHDF